MKNKHWGPHDADADLDLYRERVGYFYAKPRADTKGRVAGERLVEAFGWQKRIVVLLTPSKGRDTAVPRQHIQFVHPNLKGVANVGHKPDSPHCYYSLDVEVMSMSLMLYATGRYGADRSHNKKAETSLHQTQSQVALQEAVTRMVLINRITFFKRKKCLRSSNP